MKKILLFVASFVGLPVLLGALPPLAMFKALVTLGNKDGAAALFAAFPKPDSTKEGKMTNQAIEFFTNKFSVAPKAPAATVAVPWKDTEKTVTAKFKKLAEAGIDNAYLLQVMNAMAKEGTDIKALDAAVKALK